MPMEHMNASWPGFVAVNSMMFSPCLSGLVILSDGMVMTLVQPYAASPLIFQRTGRPALIVRLLGSYPYEVTAMDTSCTSPVITGAGAEPC